MDGLGSRGAGEPQESQGVQAQESAETQQDKLAAEFDASLAVIRKILTDLRR